MPNVAQLPPFQHQHAVPDAMLYRFNPKTIVWHTLEKQRLKSLGLDHKYSRHFNIERKQKKEYQEPLSWQVGSTGTTTSQSTRTEQTDPTSLKPEFLRSQTLPLSIDHSMSFSVNALAPFSTSAKPTCGYFFSRVTSNKKKKFGIPPSDLVKWRS